jgi:drug/metabolite transporter (DMT)-like permease
VIAVLERRRSQLPLFAVVIAVVAWSSGPLWVRGASVSATTVAFWRLWLAVPVMWALAYSRGGRCSLPMLKRASFPGALFGASMVLGFSSFQHTSIANATLIGSLTPVVVLLVAKRLFGDNVEPRLFGLAAVALAAVTLVVLSGPAGGSSSLKGDAYAVANLILWTVYFIRAKQLRDDGLHSWTFIATIFTVAAVVVTPYCLVVSQDLGASGPKDWVMYFGMILGPGVVGHGLMTWAQAEVDISVSSVLTLGNAPLSMVGAWILYGQALNLRQGLGVCVVLGALALIALAQAAGRRLPELVTEPA